MTSSEHPGNAAAPTRLLLIDGHAMAFRAFFALPADGFTDGRGQSTNAVYGFARMLFNVVASEQPTHVAVAFDMAGGTFRDRIYDQYKAGREETPQQFIGQIALIQKTLDALGVSWLEVPDYEADDIIASLATRMRSRGQEALIVSSDRDALQLVGPGVTLLQPVKGVTELRRMDPAAVQEKYQVDPEHYPDLAALVGESADNLSGVPGVGPKTAAKWLGKYGSLEGLLEHAEEITGKAGQSLRDHVEDVRRNRVMNAAVTDLELPDDDIVFTLGRGDRAAVNEVFDDLAFGPTIRRDLPAVFLPEGAADEEPGAADVEMPELVRPRGAEIATALSGPFSGGAALAIDGSWELGLGEATRLALATATDLAVLDLTDLDGDAEQALANWLSDRSIPKTAHDTKYAVHELSPRGLQVDGWRTDLGLAEFLCRPDQRPTDLAGLVMRHLQEELETTASGSQQTLDLDGGGSAAADEALARAAHAVHRLEPLLRADLEEHEAQALHDDLELPLAQVLGQMEAVGIQAEDSVLAELDAEHERQQTQVAESAFSHIGGDRINLGSPKQLQEVLYERLEMPKGRRTKTGYSTNAETLTDLFEKTQHPFLADLLAHRDVTKMRQIIETLRRFIAEDSRIHTTFHQNIAATGRLSSNNPNLQNIPMRTEEGRRIRGAFVVSEGYEQLLTADYSQIEMRIMAHLSGDEGLIEAFRSGEDLHNFVASRVFDVEPDQVDGAMRSKTKAVSYGLAYGLSAFGLSRQLRISQAEATALRDGYFERFGGVRDFLRESVEQARKVGYTQTILGRRRYLPDLTSDNRQRRENAERVALNSPIQGSAADIIKLAMLRVDADLRAAGVASRVLLQVHDELVLEVAPGELEQVRDLVVTGMGDAYEISVPLSVGVGVGRTWLEAAH
ncbi:DNA polymerase I [Brachybacterium endophyticum]|uniref:DNA polymerase I n=1 Tax=Brachybacterium endophyticum TaxID=2182385 RepID=A0A2U2RJ26_9MICO|nr:DNA polymerase I [Brachybacterium endophyticum]PWH05784.1 DNA polymerase I [Brachybacterium endophyticum]